MVAGATGDTNYTKFARTLDDAAKEVGVNFIGGFSALVPKGFIRGDLNLINSLPEALASTERVCGSVNLATIARLCARFWDAGSGSVKIGGTDIKSIPKKDLMDNISFVFQNSYMFEGTLREKLNSL